jgi:hypothetical protein
MIYKVKLLLKNHAKTIALFSLIGSSTISVALAGPHVHGQGQLSIAMEAEQIQLQLSMPAGDVVGFEHAPTNETERSQILKTKTQLKDTAQLFVFDGTQCQISQVSIDMAGVDSAANGLVKDGHSHEHEHDKKSQHTNIFAHYVFDCSNVNALSGLAVNVFDAFPAITNINAQWISGRGQGASDVSAQARQVRF